MIRDNSHERPATLYLLACILAVQALGAVYGGVALVMSPSGGILKMPVEMLSGSPFKSFLVPGLILLVVLGILPGMLVYALMWRPVWKRAGILNLYPDIHWSWTYSLYLGIMLIIWILVEIIWVPNDMLQTIFGMVGVIIVILALMPSTMHHFGWKNLVQHGNSNTI